MLTFFSKHTWEGSWVVMQLRGFSGRISSEPMLSKMMKDHRNQKNCITISSLNLSNKVVTRWVSQHQKWSYCKIHGSENWGKLGFPSIVVIPTHVPLSHLQLIKLSNHRVPSIAITLTHVLLPHHETRADVGIGRWDMLRLKRGSRERKGMMMDWEIVMVIVRVDALSLLF